MAGGGDFLTRRASGYGNSIYSHYSIYCMGTEYASQYTNPFAISRPPETRYLRRDVTVNTRRLDTSVIRIGICAKSHWL